MIQRQLQPELPGDADSGKNIVRPVRMNLQGQLSRQHRQHGFQLGIIGGRLFSCLFLGISLGMPKQIPQQGCHPHTSHRRLASVLTVAVLGIFPEGGLHGGRCFQDHIIHPLARQFDHRKGAADNIGTARARAGRSHTSAQSIGKSFVLGINGIYGTKLRC